MTQQQDRPVTALGLAMAEPLSERTQAFFAKCQEKLGLVPNVLLAYAFDERKLEAFSTFYNDLMLGESELSKLDREIIAVVAFFAMSNRVASATDMRPNDDYHDIAR